MAASENDAKRYRDLMDKALRQLKDADRRLKAMERDSREPIAILGIGCRLPGAVDSPDGFWDALMAGFHPIEDVPKERFDVDAYFDADADEPGTMYTRRGSFVRAIERFDPGFFGISPREAEAMDPQHRLLLEVAWEALERAGLVPRALRGSTTGVYVGLSANDYTQLATRAPHVIDAHTGVGNSMAVAAGRLAYTFGFEGPAMTVDTACSASLVAVHLACQGLLSGDADLALAAGVNLVLSPVGTLIESRSRMLSPDGVCRTFDASANGIVRGEGCGVIVLKRLSHALRDRDPIVAVIKATAVNQDGRSGGLTVPNGPAQQRVIAKALERAGVSAHDVGYVEAHGTGTPLGDPIEIEALGESYAASREAARPLLVGSVKTNLGHLEGAAGIVGLIKAALCVERAAIPRHLHLEKLNSHIDWSTWPIAVATQAGAWPAGYAQRIAAVSSFGFSGTNAHAILAEAPAPDTAPKATGPLFLPLSAGSRAGLTELARRYRGLLDKEAVRAEDVCFTAAYGRTHHAHRLAVTGQDAADLVRQLDEFGASAVASPRAVSEGATIAFLFTGQGAQHVGMARTLWLHEPAFREAWDRCEAIVSAQAGFRLSELVFGAQASDEVLTQTQHAQPALFALEYALSCWWKARGVKPAALLGYSLGEYVAAHLAGVFGLEDALRLVCERGRLMQSLGTDGAMAAVETSEHEARLALDGCERYVAIASVNGPAQVVLSGYQHALSVVLDEFRERGVRSQLLRVSHAFHSPQMDSILEPFRACVAAMKLEVPRVALVSNLTGGFVRDEVRDPDYWVRHLRHTVRFADGLDALERAGQRVLIELGPKPTLLGIVRRREDASSFVGVPSVRPGQDDRAHLWSALGAVYEAGAIDAFVPPESGGRRRDCPTYPFDRKPYWIMKQNRWFGEHDPRPRGALALGGREVRSAVLSSGIRVFELEVSASAPAFLAQHRLEDRAVLPATGYIEIVLATAEQLPGGRRAIEALELLRPLALDDEPVVLQVVVREHAFEIFRREPNDTWALHARGRLSSGEERPNVEFRPSAEESAVDLGEHYRACSVRGIEYGPAFRSLKNVTRGSDGAWAELRMADDVRRESASYVFHPAVLDACLQLFAIAGTQPDDERTFLPAGLERFQCWGRGSDVHRVQLKRRAEEGLADLWMWDARGQLVATVEGLLARPLTPKVKPPWANWLFETRWQPAQLAEITAEPSSSVDRWVVFTDAPSAADPIAIELRARGGQVTTVSRGMDFAATEPGHVVLSPRRPDHFQRLLDQAHVRRGERLGFVYLWSFDLRGALLLTQALAERSASASRLVFVTPRCQSVQGDDVVQPPMPAMLWGFAQSLQHELSDLQIGVADIAEASADTPALVSWMQRFSNEDRLAVRGGKLYVPRLSRLQLDSDAPSNPPEWPLREGASYLVTGGTGALGMEAMRWLLARGASKVYLLARRKPHTMPDEGSGRVELVLGDVTDAARVREVVASIPDLRGIVHAAGTLSDALLPRQSWSEMDRVLGPKVSGAWNLHLATEGLPLDFFIAFGSMAGTVGNVGQSGYGAANAFLDAFAHHRRARGLPATTVAWGSWGARGMAGQVARPAGANGYEAIEPAPGFAALEAVAGAGLAQACIAPMQWDTWLSEHRGCSRQGLFTAFATERRPAWNDASDLRRVLDEAPPSAVQSIVHGHVAEEIAAVLKLDKDDLASVWRHNLMERGMDSLMAVELRDRLSRAFDRTLPATLVFFNPTPQALAEHLTELELSQKPTPEPAEPVGDVHAMSAVDLEQLIHDAWNSLQNGSPSR